MNDNQILIFGGTEGYNLFQDAIIFDTNSFDNAERLNKIYVHDHRENRRIYNNKYMDDVRYLRFQTAAN